MSYPAVPYTVLSFSNVLHDSHSLDAYKAALDEQQA